VTDEDYKKCWAHIAKEVLKLVVKKTPGGEAFVDFLKQWGCFSADSGPALIKKCMGFVCKVAKIPGCALYTIGNFLEACLTVTVDMIARWIGPNTLGRLVDEWQGKDCAQTSTQQACRMCCRAQGSLNPETGIDEVSNCEKKAKCNEKKQLR
jgi:hypothetical protein